MEIVRRSNVVISHTPSERFCRIRSVTAVRHDGRDQSVGPVSLCLVLTLLRRGFGLEDLSYRCGSNRRSNRGVLERSLMMETDPPGVSLLRSLFKNLG